MDELTARQDFIPRLKSISTLILVSLSSIVIQRAWSAARSAVPPSAAPVRSTLATAAVRAASDLIRKNHPGPVDPANPEFKPTLERASCVALRKAAKATTYESVRFLLSEFYWTFRDGHLVIIPTLDRDTIRWPRFTLRWLDDQAFVRTRAAEEKVLPRAGGARPLVRWKRSQDALE